MLLVVFFPSGEQFSLHLDRNNTTYSYWRLIFVWWCFSVRTFFPHFVHHDSDLSGASAICLRDVKFNIFTPQKMEALSGSCLQIPCTFRVQGEFDSAATTCGLWMKEDTDKDNTIFNSCGSPNIYPMTITGDLNQKNCTTLFSDLLTSYSNEYFFRIQNPLFRANAGCDTLRIEVKGKSCFDQFKWFFFE